jgi:RNA polymerase sigma factor FliA
VASPAGRGQDEIEKLWQRYRETGDRRLRDQLVLTYVPLVRHLAYRKVRELPAWCEVDDLVSNGVEGLIGALDRYDPAKGATLEQFVWTRIQGAVLDSLRRLDWAPRSLRRWERDAERAGDEFFRDQGRRPTDSELAAKMGIGTDELAARRRDLVTAELTSLDSVTSVGEEEDGVALSQTIPDLDCRADPENEAAKSLASERFRRAFSHLSDRERRVAVMLYTQGRTLSEIGEVIGVSESRVCQIHGELKKRLKSSLRRDADLFTASA